MNANEMLARFGWPYDSQYRAQLERDRKLKEERRKQNELSGSDERQQSVHGSRGECVPCDHASY